MAINDSKSTNPHSVEFSLSKLDSSKKTLLILGGLKKNISFRDLDLPQSVHTVYLFGQDRKKIAEEIAHEDIVIRECLDEIIDEVIISKLKKPNSFTGEDMAEIFCHGSVYIQNRIMELLSDSGVRSANPGEFL